MTYDARIGFGFADVGRVRLHYARAGDGDKLVVLLHGFPEFWYSWRHQLAALCDEYTVVAPDLRGYNLSDKPLNASAYVIDELVADVVGLVHHFGREKAAVIGHDWGASVAWGLAMKRPQVVWKLGALQVPPIPIWKRNQSAGQIRASWYMFFFQLPTLPEYLFRRNDYAALSKRLMETTAVPEMFSPAEIDEYKRAWSQPGAPTAMLNYYRANVVRRMFGKVPVLTKIDIPTVFIYGEKDKAVLPRTVTGVGDMIAGPYQEHRIAHAAHWVQQEAHDEVSDILRAFLAE